MSFRDLRGNAVFRVMRRYSKQVFGVFVCAGLSACVGPNAPIYNPSRPIEWSFWVGAKQQGEIVDAQTLESGLLQEPKAAPFVKKWKVLSTAGSVVSAVGGGLIGWPLGERLGGAEDPHWQLAYAGAGVIVVGVGLGLWGVSAFGDAAEAHNAALGDSKEQGFFVHRSGLGYQW